ncbi:MAG TPA: DNA repair protein RecO [Candidatus Saccharimonadales bacterium]|nr:DNA repair protein RecO [Candidatus Saccharimonadales bacterium]
MKQLVAPAIILARTDYGEADRILTLLTPELGKLRVLAKGVRRVKSKLAGGIELFSVSTITFIQGRAAGSLGTLVSTRLVKHYGHIVQDLDRTMLGYELIKQLNKTIEDEAEDVYFHLLEQAFEALDDAAVPLAVVRFWFQAQLLRLGGHTPNLHTDAAGNKLEPGLEYDFSLEAMCFSPRSKGRFTASHIKFLRLCFAGNPPKILARVQASEALAAVLAPLVTAMAQAQA